MLLCLVQRFRQLATFGVASSLGISIVLHISTDLVAFATPEGITSAACYSKFRQTSIQVNYKNNINCEYESEQDFKKQFI